MHHDFPRIGLSYVVISLVLLLAGCAGDGSKKVSKPRINDKLVVIQVFDKKPTTTGGCSVSLKIINRMRDSTWEGVSYHLTLTNKRNASVGSLIGAPRKPTTSGGHLTDTGKVVWAACSDIAGVTPVYFGYYPSGKNQVSLHLSHIQAEIQN